MTNNCKYIFNFTASLGTQLLRAFRKAVKVHLRDKENRSESLKIQRALFGR